MINLGLEMSGRFKASGPEVELGPKAALCFSLVLYELVTNANKYGALSVDTGTVENEWSVRRRGGRQALEFHLGGIRRPGCVGPEQEGLRHTAHKLQPVGLRGGLSGLRPDRSHPHAGCTASEAALWRLAGAHEAKTKASRMRLILLRKGLNDSWMEREKSALPEAGSGCIQLQSNDGRPHRPAITDMRVDISVCLCVLPRV